MPPPIPLSELRMEDLIAFRIPPYVVPCPCSIAWMKEKVIAPVEVTLDKLCHQSKGHSIVSHYIESINIHIQNSELKRIKEFYIRISWALIIITTTEGYNFSATCSFPCSWSRTMIFPYISSSSTFKGNQIWDNRYTKYFWIGFRLRAIYYILVLEPTDY